MPSFSSARVEAVLVERRGLQRLSVRMDDGAEARAYCLSALTGTCEVGDEVVCNTTAVELGLGTGGWHVVHWNLARRHLDSADPGHVMKLRYTSLQTAAGTSELEHPAAADAPLEGIPVIACTVHSQIAPVAAAFAHVAPGRRLVWVMTDGAALPLALSDLAEAMGTAGLLAGTVTAGHAFGGDLEAVGVPSALGLACHVLDADAVVVAMGPGVVGTGTALGTTATEAAGVLDTTAARGGRPVLCVRASDGDPRPRHRGVSHHVTTVLSLASARPVVAAVPAEVADLDGVEVVEPPAHPPAHELLEAHGLEVTTMGRGPDRDPLFFAAAAAAGAVAAAMVGPS